MEISKTQRSILLLLATGAVAGILGGLLGVGGGVVLVPALVFFFGFDQHRAHGTSLIVLVFVSLVAMLGYFRHGFIDWGIALYVMIGSVTGAMIGGMLVHKIKSRALRIFFCALMIVVAARMILKGFGIDLFSASIDYDSQSFALKMSIFIITGLATGVLSAILGVGGGLIVVPTMVVALGLQQQVAQGISLAVILPTALTGAYMHIRKGNADLNVGKWAGIGAALTALLGSNFASGLKSDTLELIFGIFMVIMAVVMFLKKEKKQETLKVDGVKG